MDEKHLKSVPFFGALGKNERQTLSQITDEIDVPDCQSLAREGEFAYEFFVIQDGTAEVTHEGETIAQLGPGDFFGEVGILATERRMATVTATSPMALIVLTRGALRTVRREHPGVAERLRQAIDERYAPA
jgi:CRP/FNR family transcriptional regulator, cyclic AMP receptor protein